MSALKMTGTAGAGCVGVPYTYDVATQGGTPPYSHALTAGSLPPGLALSVQGIISGKPTTTGTYTFTVKVTDNVAGTAAMAFTIVVSPAPPGYGSGNDLDYLRKLFV